MGTPIGCERFPAKRLAGENRPVTGSHKASCARSWSPQMTKAMRAMSSWWAPTMRASASASPAAASATVAAAMVPVNVRSPTMPYRCREGGSVPRGRSPVRRFVDRGLVEVRHRVPVCGLRRSQVQELYRSGRGAIHHREGRDPRAVDRACHAQLMDETRRRIGSPTHRPGVSSGPRSRGRQTPGNSRGRASRTQRLPPCSPPGS